MVGDIIAGVTGFGAVLVYGFVIRSLQDEVKKMNDEKIDKTMCDQVHGEIIRDLDRGMDRFKDISKKLDSHGATLSSMEKNVALLSQSMGTMSKSLEKMEAKGNG